MSDFINKEELEEAQKAGIRFYSSPEEKELAYLKEGMARTDKEKFLFLMNLIRLQRTMQRAKHKTRWI